MEASQTGHLVLSTLHTNDVPSTVNRLLTLGVERYLIADSLLLVSAQRLLQKLCDACKIRCTTGFIKGQTPCSNCNNTGYSGRLPVFEYCIKPSPDLVYNFDAKIFARHLKQTLTQETIKLIEEGLVDSRLIKVDERNALC